MSEYKNKGWSVTMAGLGINLALGILYTWSIFKQAIQESILSGDGRFNWDIASLNGKMIRPGVLEGRRNEQYKRKDLDWPEQMKPSANDWQEWKRVLTSIRAPHQPQKLQQPVAEWIKRDE